MECGLQPADFRPQDRSGQSDEGMELPAVEGWPLVSRRPEEQCWRGRLAAGGHFVHLHAELAGRADPSAVRGRDNRSWGMLARFYGVSNMAGVLVHAAWGLIGGCVLGMAVRVMRPRDDGHAEGDMGNL